MTMNHTDPLDQEPVFRLKGNLLAVTVLELLHNDLDRLDRQLSDKVASAPNFFHDTPLLLGLEQLAEDEPDLDLDALLDLCQRHGLLPLGMRARRGADLAAAQALGIPLLPSGGRERAPLAEPAAPRVEEPPPEPAVNATRVITRPVRGGQQVYAPKGDLIVLSAVSPGAELIADGNVHVYGPLRGRVLAGASGDTAARIFCQQLTAELLSIAGRYKVAEDLRRSPQWGKSVQASLVGDVLNITRL